MYTPVSGHWYIRLWWIDPANNLRTEYTEPAGQCYTSPVSDDIPAETDKQPDNSPVGTTYFIKNVISKIRNAGIHR